MANNGKLFSVKISVQKGQGAKKSQKPFWVSGGDVFAFPLNFFSLVFFISVVCLHAVKASSLSPPLLFWRCFVLTGVSTWHEILIFAITLHIFFFSFFPLHRCYVYQHNTLARSKETRPTNLYSLIVVRKRTRFMWYRILISQAVGRAQPHT